jgi:hypothetical protein
MVGLWCVAGTYTDCVSSLNRAALYREAGGIKGLTTFGVNWA